ncbi:unnamed protein product [Cuscuta epithymum]|nr:unnamed protein product [Cuscuta epithymum]
MMANGKANGHGAFKFLLTSYLFSMILSINWPFVCSASQQGMARLNVIHRLGQGYGKVDRSTMMSKLLRSQKARLDASGDRRLANVSSTFGIHTMQVKLGSKKTNLSLVLDTGSHLTWTQCQPCTEEDDGLSQCFNQSGPIYDPSKSTKYSDVLFDSTACSDVYQATGLTASAVRSTNDTLICGYNVYYAEDVDSRSTGNLGVDQLKFLGSEEEEDGGAFNLTFGCGHNNNLSGRLDAAGVMGLAQSNLSIVSQMSKEVRKCFSYCLPTENGTGGYAAFGCRRPKTPTGQHVGYTNLTEPPPGVDVNNYVSGLYYVDLTNISVNGKALEMNCTAGFRHAVGMFVDSASPISILPPTVYAALNKSFSDHMKDYRRAPGNESGILDNCYNFTNRPNPTIPNISFTFGGGMEVVLHRSAVMVPVSADRTSKVCLGFGANKNDMYNVTGVFGNLQQQTLEMFYDLEGGTLGFSQDSCT